MKKLIGMLVVALMVIAFGTGCATVNPVTKFGSDSNLFGDIPKIGQVVRVVAVIGRETSGPYEYLMVWEPTEGGGEARVMRMAEHCLVERKSESFKGQYLVQKDEETVIKFTRLER